MYVFDSSAIIEMIKGNEAVIEKYQEHPLLIINLVYGECYFYCIKTGVKKEKFSAVPFQLLEYTLLDIEEAMQLLYERKKATKDFSFVDAIVYTVVKKHNLTLVTKDYGFKGLSNVEFITD